MTKVVQIAASAAQGKTDTIINTAVGFAIQGYGVVIWNGETKAEEFAARLPKCLPVTVQIVVMDETVTREGIDEALEKLYATHPPEKCLLFVDDPVRCTRPTRDYQPMDYLISKFDRVWKTVQLRRERGHVI